MGIDSSLAANVSAAPPLDEKLRRCHAILRDLRRVAVAFSGGVDSTCILKLAADVLGPANVLAVTGVSSSVAERELDDARALARRIGVEHVLLDTHEFEDPNYLANPTNRCYFCKTELYSRMTELLARRESAAQSPCATSVPTAEGGCATIGWTIISGTNADDLGDYRPGLAAAGEHAVRAPLAEAGLTKADVRALSAALGLPTHDKPASPCLSSRVQYGEAITPEKLGMIERAEAMLRELGFRECRVRHHDKLARIEVPAGQIAALAAPELRSKIDAAFREIGYHFVTLDLRGFRSGSMNEVIAFGRRQG
jgi:uncharacterized protein